MTARTVARRGPGRRSGDGDRAYGGRSRSGDRAYGGRPGRGDGGQVSVELLGITPLILVVLVLVWQFVLVGYTFTLAGDAADKAARAAALGQDAGAAGRADLPSAWAAGSTVAAATDGDLVKVSVGLRVPVLFPGSVDFPFTVTGEAAAAKETP